MLKKLVASFVLTAFTQAYAVTPVQQSFSMADELNRSFDELNYKINVEWNQTDSKFMGKALDDFEKEITTLQSKGLSADQLIEYTLNNVKDQKTKDEILAIANAVNENQMNSEEARAFVLTQLDKMYSHGTSWSGSRIGHHVGIILGVIVLIILCTQHGGKKKPHEQKDPNCQEEPTHGHKGNNGWGNGDQDAPGGSCTHNNAENQDCVA